MSNENKIAIVIPALNEGESIVGVVDEALSSNTCDVFVVDDFSSDSTAERANESGATVITLASPLGAWGATQTGIRYALQQGYRVIVTMDADGQHPPGAVHELVEPIKRGAAHFTIGTCPARGSSMRHIAWWILRKLSGLKFADLTSGLRAYDHGAASLLASRQASILDYQDVGVLVLLKRYGYVGSEVPVSMARRLSGRSKVFSSWAKVFSYMAYSILLAVSKRGPRRMPPQQVGLLR